MLRFGWVAAVAVALLLGIMMWRSSSAAARDAAPDFSLKDVNGSTVHLHDYRGKVVVLDFWATYCEPCQMEVPWFTQFEREKRNRGFAVLGISLDDDWSPVRPFLKQFGVNYRVMLSDRQTEKSYGGQEGIEAIPTTFLIDRAGHIYKRHVGLVPRKEFENDIDTLLGDSAGATRASSITGAGATRANTATHHL